MLAFETRCQCWVPVLGAGCALVLGVLVLAGRWRCGDNNNPLGLNHPIHIAQLSSDKLPGKL